MEGGLDTYVETVTEKASHSFQEEETSCGVHFSPPLYLQRYMLALEYLTRHSIQTVIDFGCSECGFFRLLSTAPSLRQIAFVDIDRSLLMSKRRVISPEVRDYVHRRSNPLEVLMYAGSAGDYDYRMKGYQAVTLIEVIEHLHPGVLECVTHNVFGAIQPQHIVVTTPNSEFNVLFGNDDPGTFRHWDHKFEWSREQFQSWCQTVCTSYGYVVEYTGVGFQTDAQSSVDLGPCSQAALFQRKEYPNGLEMSFDLQKSGERPVYELITKYEFPYDDNKMSTEEKLDLEITYILRQTAQLKALGYDDNDDGDDNRVFSIDISHIANRSSIKHLASPQKIREYLKQKSYVVSEDGSTLTVNVSEFIGNADNDDDDDENGDDDDNSVNDYDPNGHYANLNEHSSENWDNEYLLDERNVGVWTGTTGPCSKLAETAKDEVCEDTPDTSVK